MSQEVSLNSEDYRVIMSWFDRIFADGIKDPTSTDQRTYNKMCVMGWAFADEMDFIHGKKKDRDRDDLGR